jgi:hypothetical protein
MYVAHAYSCINAYDILCVCVCVCVGTEEYGSQPFGHVTKAAILSCHQGSHLVISPGTAHHSGDPRDIPSGMLTMEQRCDPRCACVCTCVRVFMCVCGVCVDVMCMCVRVARACVYG